MAQQPGMPGSQFPSDDDLSRRVKQLQRAMQEERALRANQLAAMPTAADVTAEIAAAVAPFGNIGVISYEGNGTQNNVAVTAVANLTRVAAESTHTSFGTVGASGFTADTAGVYGFSLTWFLTGGASGRCFVEINPQFTSAGLSYRGGMNAGEDTAAVSVGALYVPASGNVKFNVYQSTGAAKTYAAALQIMRIA